MKLSTQIVATISGIIVLAQITFGAVSYWIIGFDLDARFLTASAIIIFLAIVLALFLGSSINRKLKEKNDELEHQALHDKLTGLANRTLLFDRIEQARSRADRDNEAFALLMLDLNNFKEVNDTLGHHFGDLMLKEISSNLQLSLRDSDSLARLGGDEFAIILHSTDEDGTHVCISRIIHKLKTPIHIEDTQIEASASIGVAIYPQHGEDAKSLLKHADIAMYQAKQLNSNYAMYDPVNDSYSVKNLTLMSELRKAVEQNDIIAHYQPMINQKNNLTVAIEALARWDHPELGVISPADFIPIAERTGVIQKLTFSILDKALIDLKKWLEKGYELSLAINISTYCLQDSLFPEKIHAAVQKTGIPTSNIKLEITESALMQDLESARKMLDDLHRAGFIISIDDFGTGFSSMSYLKELPVDILKVDKSFIFDMKNSKSEAIVHSIIELAHNLGCTVIAEGVETEEALEHLLKLNNDIAQGYLFSRALPRDEMSQWLEESSWPPSSTNTGEIVGVRESQKEKNNPRDGN